MFGHDPGSAVVCPGLQQDAAFCDCGSASIMTGNPSLHVGQAEFARLFFSTSFITCPVYERPSKPVNGERGVGRYFPERVAHPSLRKRSTGGTGKHIVAGIRVLVSFDREQKRQSDV